RMVELLAKTFDASAPATDLLVRRPQLLEELTQSEALDDAFSVSDHLSQLESLGAKSSNLDPVRAYRQTQLLRIVLRDLLALTDLPSLFAEYSALAAASLLFVNRLLGNED